MNRIIMSCAVDTLTTPQMSPSNATTRIRSEAANTNSSGSTTSLAIVNVALVEVSGWQLPHCLLQPAQLQYLAVGRVSATLKNSKAHKAMASRPVS